MGSLQREILGAFPLFAALRQAHTIAVCWFYSSVGDKWLTARSVLSAKKAPSVRADFSKSREPIGHGETPLGKGRALSYGVFRQTPEGGKKYVFHKAKVTAKS